MVYLASKCSLSREIERLVNLLGNPNIGNHFGIEDIVDSNLAVLIIDMSHDEYKYATGGSIDGKHGMVRHQQEVIEYCAEHDIPVIALGCEGPIIFGKRFDIIDELMNGVDKVPQHRKLKKKHSSVFVGTDLHSQLQDLWVDTLMLMGLNASGCVYQSAYDAIGLGYRVITSPNLIGDRHGSENMSRSFEWYRKNGLFTEDYMEVLRAVNLPSQRVA